MRSSTSLISLYEKASAGQPQVVVVIEGERASMAGLLLLLTGATAQGAGVLEGRAFKNYTSAAILLLLYLALL